MAKNTRLMGPECLPRILSFLPKNTSLFVQYLPVKFLSGKNFAWKHLFYATDLIYNWLGVYNNNKQEMTLLGWLAFHFLIKSTRMMCE